MTEDQSISDSGKISWIGKIRRFFSERTNDSKGLIELLRQAQKKQVMDSDALSIMEGALQMSTMQVREIMIPRSQIVTVKASSLPTEFLPQVIEASHSRFPVIGNGIDDIVGILLAKDLLRLVLDKNFNKFEIRDILRPATFVPESKRLNVLLGEFRETRNHMAIVIDEYGGVSGVVTIEDVLEQIVGEIEDEFDVDDESYIKIFDEENYIVKAITPVIDFNEVFHSRLSNEEFDTIGGLVLQRFGHIPERDESIGIGPYIFKVLNADNRQIRLLKVTTSLTDSKNSSKQ